MLRRTAPFWLGFLVACSSSDGESGGNTGGSGGSAGMGGGAGAAGATGGASSKPAIDVGIISKSSGSNRESESNVVASKDGRVVAAWIGFGSSEPAHIGYAISTNSGQEWAPPERLFAPKGGDSADPSLTADAQGNVYLAWLEFNVLPSGAEGPAHVWVAKSPAGSTKFEPAVLASDGLETVVLDKPFIGITQANEALVTYFRQTGAFGKTTALVAALSPGGVAFERSIVVDEGSVVNHDPSPCASTTGSRVWVTHIWYQGSITTARHVALRWSDDGGATWPSANVVQISEDAETNVGFDDPRCVTVGEDVWVSYGLSNETPSASSFGTLYAMRLARVSSAGSVVERMDVNDGSGKKLFLHPQLVRDSDGALLLAYYAGDAEGDAAGSVRFARSIDGGHVFGPSHVLHEPVTFMSSRSSARWIGEYFGASALARDLYSAYVDNSGSVAHVGFARVPTADSPRR